MPASSLVAEVNIPHLSRTFARDKYSDEEERGRKMSRRGKGDGRRSCSASRGDVLQIASSRHV